jgi:hypothetical protein
MFHAAEHIAAGTVEKIWNGPEDFALGSLSDAGGAE